jgi:hypothetical protein
MRAPARLSAMPRVRRAGFASRNKRARGVSVSVASSRALESAPFRPLSTSCPPMSTFGPPRFRRLLLRSTGLRFTRLASWRSHSSRTIAKTIAPVAPPATIASSISRSIFKFCLDFKIISVCVQVPAGEGRSEGHRTTSPTEVRLVRALAIVPAGARLSLRTLIARGCGSN